MGMDYTFPFNDECKKDVQIKRRITEVNKLAEDVCGNKSFGITQSMK